MDFSNKESNQKLADYLREQRLNRSLNLDDVSDKIGVPIQHLKNIESGDFSRFDEFYLKMYIKKYASFLSLNVDEIYQSFYGEQIKREVEVKIKKQKTEKRTRNFGRLGGIVAAILVIGLGGYFVIDMIKAASEKPTEEVVIKNPNSSELINEPTKNTENEEKKDAEMVEPEISLPKTTISKVSQNNQSTIYDVMSDGEQLDLKMVFNNDCWLNATMNNQSIIPGETYRTNDVFEYTFTKDMLTNNEGVLEFNIGNVTGLEMMINGELVSIDETVPHQYITLNMKVK